MNKLDTLHIKWCCLLAVLYPTQIKLKISTFLEKCIKTSVELDFPISETLFSLSSYF